MGGWRRVLVKKMIYMHDVQRLLVAAKVCLQNDWIDVSALSKKQPPLLLSLLFVSLEVSIQISMLCKKSLK